tara:strand:- start:935 stop:1189 length:255 start_codon:yes stop_codon:yes gene_type:complete
MKSEKQLKIIIKSSNSYVRENWLTLFAIALWLALAIYTPSMIESGVNECNNYWINETKDIWVEVEPELYNFTELENVIKNNVIK